jgi:hypothetical protein
MTLTESANLFYDFTINRDVAFCSEACMFTVVLLNYIFSKS